VAGSDFAYISEKDEGMEQFPTKASFSDIFKIHDHRDQRGPLLLIQQFKFPGSVFLHL
jgi:hypothetical protein